MNAKIDTKPNASSKHDAMVLDIAARLKAIGAAVAESVSLHPEDQADALGQVLDQLRLEHLRIGSAQTTAYEFAAVESEEEAEQRWQAERSTVAP